MSRNKSSIKFINLHSHDTFSVFDGLGFPKDHLDFCYENGMDAMAITNHGNMNSLGYQIQHLKKMQKEGKEFKLIYGCEFYYIDSIAEWKKEVEKLKEEEKILKLEEEEFSGVVIEDEDEIKKNIKNVLKKRSHLLLLAQNQKGLNNLFSLISESYKNDNFYRYPRIDYEILSKYSDNIIATSACIGGVYGKSVWQYKDEGEEKIKEDMIITTEKMLRLFGKDRWFGELQWNAIKEQHILNNLLIELSKEYGFKLVSVSDSHYPSPQMWRDREIYKKLGVISRDKKPEWFYDKIPDNAKELKYELYPKNGDQMWEAFVKYSKECGQSYEGEIIRESIERSYFIAHEMIETFLPDKTVRLPEFIIPREENEDGYLARLAIQGLINKGLSKNKEYVERLRKELHVIQDRGFSKYFLTMKAVVDKAREKMLIGAARGSAAGSLVSYVIGITQVDPIKWNLQFERFLRKDATDYPDIDVDFADNMKLKEQLMEEWGDDKVVPISNFNTLQLKSLIKDISRLYEIPFYEVNEVTAKMFKEAIPSAKKKHGISAGVYIPTYEETLEYSETLQKFLEKYPMVQQHIKVLHGQIKSVSRHAGGCVIGENLDKWMPLISSGGVRQTPWTEGQTVRHLEPMGFIKFDILGLTSLKMIDSCIRHILKRHFNNKNPSFEDVKFFYNETLHPDILNFNDKEVYEDIFHKGKWAGIFQFTESGAQAFCKRAKPLSLVDLAAITSIYRPAALSAKVDQKYIEAKENPEEVKYYNSIHKEVTQSTYGFLIFQEQISSLAHKLGKDISLDEGNLLRKLLTKKGTGKEGELAKIYEKFIRGCEEKGLTRNKAQELMDIIGYFSGYGFNLSHAISYSIISFQCAYLLHYYPSEWMAAFLDKEPEDKKERAINIARSLGFKIESVSINMSGRNWEIDNNDERALIQPLSCIKGLGDAAIDQIINNRPFNSIEDILLNDNVAYNKLNKGRFDALIKGQAVNFLLEKDNRFKNIKHLWHVVCDGTKPVNSKKLYEKIEEFKNVEDFSEEEKIEYLVSLTGVFPVSLVMKDKALDILKEYVIPPISEYDADLKAVWFIPREVIVKKTKKGANYYIITVTDINSVSEKIKVWSIDPTKDKVWINRPYICEMDYDENWGFYCRGVRGNFKLLA
jgi:DNA polymerase III subunit alpha